MILYGNNKYRNQKVKVNGEKFDSKKEAERWAQLRLLEKVGEITDLKRQVSFELIPSQKIGGKVVERACYYIADFVYLDSKGHIVIEDAKGVRTKEYIIKRKLMLWVHGVHIHEV